MLELIDLAKLPRTGTLSEYERDIAASLLADQPPVADLTANPGGYSREFLVGYLLHYCRLSQRLRRQGTQPVLQALLEVEPENGEVHFLLGQQYELADNMQTALDYFERAAALRPDRPSYSLAAVRAACLLGERSQALTLVCSVISAYPVMAEAYYERGLIYEADENWARALRDYEMCVRLEPENPTYLCAAASMYRHQKLFKMARRTATKALKIDPNFADAHEELRQLPFFEQFIDFFRPEEANVTG